MLDAAARGEEVCITRRGGLATRLLAPGIVDKERVHAAIARLQELAKKQRLDGLSIKKLRDEGRR